MDNVKDYYLTNICWGPSEKYIYVSVLNRDQNHLMLKKYDSNTGKFLKTLIYHHHLIILNVGILKKILKNGIMQQIKLILIQFQAYTLLEILIYQSTHQLKSMVYSISKKQVLDILLPHQYL